MPNKDQIKGKGKEAMGATREKAGQMTGNRDMEAKGTSQKWEGKTQGTMGKVKDKAGDLKDKVS
jgi:uncharacterized protein YjbJ (UPF0337 family)